MKKKNQEVSMPAVSDAQTAVTPATENVLKPHLWTHNGKEVLILRYVDKGGRSYQGNDRNGQETNFVWPLNLGDCVEAPDWTPDEKSGGGLHGWPWGLGIGDGKDPDWQATWLVFSALPENVTGNLEGGQKCKAKCGTIRFVGNWQDASNFVLDGQIALVLNTARGAASATGSRGAASATGLYSKARAGVYGCIALAWHNVPLKRVEMRCSEVGCGDGSDGKLKANTWYRLDDAGAFIETEPPNGDLS